MSDSDDWEKAAEEVIDDKKKDNKKQEEESDEDDWEKEVDDVVNDKKEESKSKAKFVDEDDVDSDDERKKKAEEAKKAKANAPPARVKQTNAKDYDKLFEERQKKKGGNKANLEGKKGEALSKAAEEDITEQLFAADLATDSSGLKSAKTYETFAK